MSFRSFVSSTRNVGDSSPLSSRHVKLAVYQQVVQAVCVQVFTVTYVQVCTTTSWFYACSKHHIQTKSVPVVSFSKVLIEDCALSSCLLSLSLKSNLISILIYMCLIPGCFIPRKTLLNLNYFLCTITSKSYLLSSHSYCLSRIRLEKLHQLSWSNLSLSLGYYLASSAGSVSQFVLFVRYGSLFKLHKDKWHNCVADYQKCFAVSQVRCNFAGLSIYAHHRVKVWLPSGLAMLGLLLMILEVWSNTSSWFAVCINSSLCVCCLVKCWTRLPV